MSFDQKAKLCLCMSTWPRQALQTMVREQALQIGALRIQQAYRGRVQAAELQRIRHVRLDLFSASDFLRAHFYHSWVAYVRGGAGGGMEAGSCAHVNCSEVNEGIYERESGEGVKLNRRLLFRIFPAAVLFFN